MAYILEASYKHDQEPRILRSRDDVHRFLGELREAGWEFTAAAMYAVEDGTDMAPGHELIVGVDDGAGLGALRYAGEDGDWYSQGDKARSTAVEYVYFGNAHEFPVDSEIPLVNVEEAITELLTSGGRRPTCVTWRSDR